VPRSSVSRDAATRDARHVIAMPHYAAMRERAQCLCVDLRLMSLDMPLYLFDDGRMRVITHDGDILRTYA